MGAATTRAHIVEAADQLFYRQGYEHTSFAAIAEAVRISRGNFYYHFKSKDDILAAVIAARLDDRRRMLERWEADEPDPVGRIGRFIEIVVTNRADIQHYGCPVGTLTTELAKLGHPALDDAGDLFTLFREWLRRQFVLLGQEAEADALAMHVLAFSQGVATLAHAFQDEDFIRREVQRMHDWLSAYAASPETAPHAGNEDAAGQTNV
ncbi:TetR/AcrR family transcriptional regulator [Streptomyces sp. PR69]|uniref:TetR/AcrR family transcriptional regulator n=1 Tax=Streptomyces sp. PR69 TaxID=2984950 RepID=UPI0022641638|nr:TetR/AcrR family transcriptional regulator [Streptomyces sp. PR69]